MKNNWSIYVIVVTISSLAGVAIAGLPNSAGTEPTIVTPAATAAPTTILAPVAVTTTTEAAAEAAAEAASTEPPQTSTTVLTTTTTTTTTTIVGEPPVARTDVVVVAVNGAGGNGLAAGVRDQLVGLGYDKARVANGTSFVDVTKVYFFDGFVSAAEQVSLDLGLDPALIEPVIMSPSFGVFNGDQVTVYIGRDRS